MEVIKADINTEFDVFYSDGTKAHVQEGVLLECKDNTIFLHMGTNRANVIFAAIESLFEFVYMLGLQDLMDEYLEKGITEMNDSKVKEEIKNFDIPNPFKARAVVDIEFCVGIEELKETLHSINQCGYTFLTATQDGDTYTVFFRRTV